MLKYKTLRCARCGRPVRMAKVEWDALRFNIAVYCAACRREHDDAEANPR